MEYTHMFHFQRNICIHQLMKRWIEIVVKEERYIAHYVSRMIVIEINFAEKTRKKNPI